MDMTCLMKKDQKNLNIYKRKWSHSSFKVTIICIRIKESISFSFNLPNSQNPSHLPLRPLPTLIFSFLSQRHSQHPILPLGLGWFACFGSETRNSNSRVYKTIKEIFDQDNKSNGWNRTNRCSHYCRSPRRSQCRRGKKVRRQRPKKRPTKT